MQPKTEITFNAATTMYDIYYTLDNYPTYVGSEATQQEADETLQAFLRHMGYSDTPSSPFVRERVTQPIVGYPGLLTGAEIRAMGLVAPCEDKVSNGKLSYGLEGCGYTIRLGRDISAFNTAVNTYTIFDPKEATQGDYTPLGVGTDKNGCDFATLPPKTFGLAVSVERIALPCDIVGLCFNKSSYARCGIQWQVTPLENGWEGFITLEWFNSTHRWVKAYIGEGVTQILFFRANQMPTQSYNGYYQNQGSSITLPKVRNI